MSSRGRRSARRERSAIVLYLSVFLLCDYSLCLTELLFPSDATILKGSIVMSDEFQLMA
jgi:hypothetical protein